MDKDNSTDNGKHRFGLRDRRQTRSLAKDSSKPTLPDFDTLRDLARENPEELERLRVALCQKVIDEAPAHAKPRLEGLMFQINARREIARSNYEAAEELSGMMNHSLKRMQSMLKDLRTIQSESILLTTRHEHKSARETNETAKILPFRTQAS